MKSSIPGDFGGNDPEIYAEALHADTVVACHMKSTFDNESNVKDTVICAGHLMAQRKVCKKAYNEYAVAVWADEDFQAMYEKMKDQVLGFDFYTHHGIEP